MEIEPSIEHYTAERIPNPYPAGALPWQVYHTVRNAVFHCCRDFGRAGPMGECPITDDEEIPDKLWHCADDWPMDFASQDFFVVDDQYNDERYIYVDVCRSTVFTSAWLKALMTTLRSFEGWGVGILAFKRAYILAFEDRLLVTGEIFRDARTLEDVVRNGKAEIEMSWPKGVSH